MYHNMTSVKERGVLSRDEAHRDNENSIYLQTVYFYKLLTFKNNIFFPPFQNSLEILLNLIIN